MPPEDVQTNVVQVQKRYVMKEDGTVVEVEADDEAQPERTESVHTTEHVTQA